VDPRIRTIAPAPTPGPTANTPSTATTISTAAASNTTRNKFHNAMQDKLIDAVERA
jgi:hypothetical protein